VRVYCSRIAWAAVVCVFGVLVPQAAHAGPNVLLLWDDDQSVVVGDDPLPSEMNASTQALITAMENAGLKVTLSETTQAGYTGFNPAPTGFDAVVHLNGNGNVLDFMQSGAAITELIAFVESDGGGVITSQNTETQIETFPAFAANMPTLMLLDLIEPITPSPPFGTMSLTPVAGFESHPLLDGLEGSLPITFEGGRMRSVLRTYGTDPATVVLRDELGLDAVAVRELGAGRIVSFHHTGNFENASTISATLQDLEVQRLYINAVLWADRHLPSATIESEQARANASGAAFVIHFSEDVDGFDDDDVQLVVGGSLAGPVNMTVTPLSDRDFRVLLTGYVGVGTLAINLLDDDTIVDQSFNDNPLVGAVSGPVCPADTVAPNLSAFSANPTLIPLAETGEFTLIFSEPMDPAYPPLLRIATAAGGIIEASPQTPPLSGRTETGLLAFYHFEEGTGNTAHDTSGVLPALDLTITNPGNVDWIDGGLSIISITRLLSGLNATKISSACVASNAVTFESWIRPLNATQIGPARIASIGNTGGRNLTLEQNAAAYETRLRTWNGASNDLTGTSAAGQVTGGALQHVVFTRGADGTARIYVDNVLATTTTIGGDFSEWDLDFKLVLGNELSPSFPWLGEFHLFAVYDRALSAAEVEQNFEAGPTTVTPGNGVWLDPIFTTYRVSLDRAVDFPDEGAAQVSIEGARDLAGNTLIPQANRPLAIISSSLVIDAQPSAFYARESGVPFEFVVEVSGAIGGLNFQWYKEDAAKAFQPVGTNAPVLAFASLEVDDSGTYYCVISDVQASVQTSPSQLDVAASLPVGGVVVLAVVGIAVALVGVRRRSAMR